MMKREDNLDREKLKRRLYAALQGPGRNGDTTDKLEYDVNLAALEAEDAKKRPRGHYNVGYSKLKASFRR